MAETLPCPGCKAELVLPALPKGQTVQCPRCRRVFEPGFAPLPPPLMVAAPVPHKTFDVSSGTLPGALGDEALPPTRYQPLRQPWKAPVAMTLLAVCVASYALQSYVHFEQALLIQKDDKFGNGRFIFEQRRGRAVHVNKVDDQLERRWSNWNALSEISVALHQAAFWPTMIFVVIWLHQAALNLRILQSGGLLYGPALAALSFFIPFVNFFQPFSVMQEIWRASDPRAVRAARSWQQAPYSITARVWWLAFSAAGALSLYARWIGHDFFLDNADSLLQARVRFLSNLCMITAGVALIVLIRGIQVRQRERHARIYDEAA